MQPHIWHIRRRERGNKGLHELHLASAAQERRGVLWRTILKVFFAFNSGVYDIFHGIFKASGFRTAWWHFLRSLNGFGHNDKFRGSGFESSVFFC